MAGPLAQSAERGADNAKVVSSTLTRTKAFFIFFCTYFLRNPFFNVMVGVYIHKNHLVYKHERRHCFVTFKIQDLYEKKPDCFCNERHRIRRDLRWLDTIIL